MHGVEEEPGRSEHIEKFQSLPYNTLTHQPYKAAAVSPLPLAF